MNHIFMSVDGYNHHAEYRFYGLKIAPKPRVF